MAKTATDDMLLPVHEIPSADEIMSKSELAYQQVKYILDGSPKTTTGEAINEVALATGETSKTISGRYYNWKRRIERNLGTPPKREKKPVSRRAKEGRQYEGALDDAIGVLESMRPLMQKADELMKVLDSLPS